MTNAPNDRDPRETIRDDLVAAARRRVATRRRRRTATLATLAVAGLLGTTGGALALGGHTTGVPFVDRMLERSSDRLERHERIDERRDLPAWARFEHPELRPGPGGASEPIDVAWLGDESRPWVGLAYANRDGEVCFTLADRDQQPDEGTRGVHGCGSAGGVGQRLDEQAAFTVCANPTSTTRDGPLVIVVCGYARGAVEEVRVTGPHGGAEAKLTEPWTPEGLGLDPLRLFVAFVETSVRHSPGLPRPDEPLVTDGLRLEATLSDGRLVELDAAPEARGGARSGARGRPSVSRRSGAARRP